MEAVFANCCCSVALFFTVAVALRYPLAATVFGTKNVNVPGIAFDE